MLYNRKMLKESYETTKIVADKINKLGIADVKVSEYENYNNDGTIKIKDNTYFVEMKCRKGDIIKKMYLKEVPVYNTITIPASSVRDSKEYYIQYDETLSYLIIFRYDDIDTSKIIVKNIKTEIGWKPIGFFEIDTADCLFIDLEKGDIKNGSEYKD